jgi:hypothetical protein
MSFFKLNFRQYNQNNFIYERRFVIMNIIQPTGFLCVVACAGLCSAGCFTCIADAALVIANAATGAPSLASGFGAGAAT